MASSAPKLHYVDDTTPGVSRKRRGRAWHYFGPDGKRITDRAEIDRLNAIGMPPAYERVWLSPDPDGHIQGIGYDARGRRQYRYHPDFRAERDSSKYDRLVGFGRKLPALRKQVTADMATDPTAYRAVIAAVVRLIDISFMRVGNEEYARANKSFGATTLRNRHVRVTGHKVRICYAGKHGIKRTVTVTDRRLARIARRTQDLPGQQLFEYIGEDGSTCPVGSSDVNDYIRDAMGDEFTAKDFRTWGASVIAFEEVARRAREHGRVHLASAIEPVAEALGNTVAISRKSYIHPALIEAAKAPEAIGEVELPRPTKYLSAAERGLIDFLAEIKRRRPKAG
jgi:DNA topoisomerase-1